MLLECYCRGVYGLRLRSSIFCCRTCVYSKIFRDIPLVGPNAISKKSNNVVISSPRVFIFSGILVPKDSFPHTWSGDLEPSGLAARGRPIFFQSRFSRQPFEQSQKYFQGRVPHDGLDLSSGGHKGRASNLGARSLKVKKNVFFILQKNPLHRFLGKSLVLDHQQNSGKTAYPSFYFFLF